MKLLPTLFVCIGFIVGLNSAATADPPHRRALLVAVNGYTHHSDNDARDLNTTPDVLALKSVMMAKWGFAEGDFKVLQTPAETTHAFKFSSPLASGTYRIRLLVMDMVGNQTLTIWTYTIK